MKNPKAITVIRSVARNQSDEDRLRAKGHTKLYRLDKPTETWGKWRMRHGEGLGVVDGFRPFGTVRGEMMEKVRLIHQKWKAIIVDVETGERSDMHGAEMLDRGLSRVVAETRAPDTARARAMQAKSVKARKDDGRVSARDAAYAWLHSPDLGNEEVAEITGWPWRTLHNKFGPRRLPRGRRAKGKTAKKRTVKRKLK